MVQSMFCCESRSPGIHGQVYLMADWFIFKTIWQSLPFTVLFILVHIFECQIGNGEYPCFSHLGHFLFELFTNWSKQTLYFLIMCITQMYNTVKGNTHMNWRTSTLIPKGMYHNEGLSFLCRLQSSVIYWNPVMKPCGKGLTFNYFYLLYIYKVRFN